MTNKVTELQQIGSRLSVCRQNKNMTQEDLAYRLGITPQALSKWERGMSLPDTSMLPEISRILEISTDYLLGISRQNALKNDGCEFQRILGENMRNALEPLELIFGRDLVPLFTDRNYADEVRELRLNLSHEGFLLPVFRIRDELRLESREFMILSYQKVLCSEELECVDENTLHYIIIDRIGACIREKYYEIVSPDLLKGLINNLKIKYPVLIDEVIPEKISYSQLTEVVRRLLRKGCPIAYLPKIIEAMGSRPECREGAVQEAEEEILRETGRDDNINIVLEKRRN